MFKNLVVIICLLFTTELLAKTSFWLGLGSVTHNVLSAQTDADGSETKKFDLTPTILVGASIPFKYLNKTFISPGLGYAKYLDTEDDYTKSEIILQYHFNYIFRPWLAFRYGFSNYITMIGGDGGSKTLNNGNSTSTFYVPSKTRSSYTASVDFGPEFILRGRWTLRTQLSIERFLSSERRSYAHLITLNYFF